MTTTTKTNWFNNLTEKKITEFLSFVHIVQDSYIMSDAIVTHSKEKRAFICQIFTQMRWAMKDKEHKDKHALWSVFQVMDGKAAFILFLQDMEACFKESVKYNDWDDVDCENVKFASELFGLIRESVKGSFGLYYG